MDDESERIVSLTIGGKICTFPLKYSEFKNNCWLVGYEGPSVCENCDLRETEDCSGKEILKKIADGEHTPTQIREKDMPLPELEWKEYHNDGLSEEDRGQQIRDLRISDMNPYPEPPPWPAEEIAFGCSVWTIFIGGFLLFTLLFSTICDRACALLP